MNADEVRLLIETDPDFIFIKRFDFSLKKLLERYPDGAPSRVICQALSMDENQVEELYQSVLQKLKSKLE